MVYKFGENPRHNRYKIYRYRTLIITVIISMLITTRIFLVHSNLIVSANPFNKNKAASHKKSKIGKSTASIITKNIKKKNINLTQSPDKISAVSNISGCSMFSAPHLGLADSQIPELRKLAQYEKLCGGSLAEKSSFFTYLPTSMSEAVSASSEMTSRLNLYSKYGIEPLIFLEPVNSDGKNIDLVQLKNGSYDQFLDSFFSSLKINGITSETIGEWVILPEGNTPAWSTSDPSVFSAGVTKIAQYQKKYFPGSLSSIMLESQTYLPNQSWGDGNYTSLRPYIETIPKGLIDSFGLQGFPWASAANQGGEKYYDPAVYLRADLAIEAANTLGVKNIWYNTGTFNKMYTQNASSTITASSAERQFILSGVIKQLSYIKSQGYTAELHIFAQNKSNTSEDIDWSYWKDQPDLADKNTAIFVAFVHDLKSAQIPLWLFDTDAKD